MSLALLKHSALCQCRLPSAARASSRRRLCAPPAAAAASAASGERSATRSGAPPPPAHAEKLDLSPPKGTRDFFPDDMRLRTWLFDHFEAVSQLCGFERYDSPVLENEALFVRKAGEEIRDQLFNFEDKGGRRVALRPELTPSLSRMVLSKGSSLALPVKWYGVGQCWRYERMTRGRRREHYQWNMDIVGVAGVAAEAELLAAVTAFFERVGVGASDVKIKVNNRKARCYSACVAKQCLFPVSTHRSGSYTVVCCCLQRRWRLWAALLLAHVPVLRTPERPWPLTTFRACGRKAVIHNTRQNDIVSTISCCRRCCKR